MTKRPEPNSLVMLLNLVLNLFQYCFSIWLAFFCFQQTHLSSPSLPTGRQAQEGVFRCDFNKLHSSWACRRVFLAFVQQVLISFLFSAMNDRGTHGRSLATCFSKELNFSLTFFAFIFILLPSKYHLISKPRSKAAGHLKY